MVSTYRAIGGVYHAQRKFDKAYKKYKKCLDIENKYYKEDTI